MLPTSCSEISSTFKLGQGLQYDKNAEFLKGLDLLQIVDFTGNNLENLHQNLFLSQTNSLSSINLSNNKFNKFPLDLSKFSRQYIYTNNFHCYPMLHAFQKAISKTLEFDSCIVLCYHADKSAICY
jgi:hypothetical protein